MTRRGNGNDTKLVFLPHERGALKPNRPGPSGQLGGYQKAEHWLLEHIDPETGECWLDPYWLKRFVNYASGKYGPGGPNKRIRTAFIPAYRRATGIDLAWQ